jgi:hypothetical protein
MRQLHADTPITEASQDRLGRDAVARLIATEIRQAPSDAGFVLSLMGPWGAGKTSVLNLIGLELHESVEVLRFDPWLFAGAEQLVTRFFEELGAQLGSSSNRRMRELAGSFADYGATLTPLLQLALGPTGLAITSLLRHKQASAKAKRGSASAQRKALQRRLRDIDRPIVVFIDDIDRLPAHEVREVVRLVKLVGDLPGVRYVLAFDRRRVELALGDQTETGRAYLEKIVQAPHDLPTVAPATLRRLALEELNARLSDTELPFFSQEAWGQLFGTGIAPMLSTLRDVHRYANVAPAALELVGGEVASHDVLALEALRLFDPDVHASLPKLADVLTGRRGIDIRSPEQVEADARTRVEAAMKCSSHPEATRELLGSLFPAAGHLFGRSRGSADDRAWRSRRRVASATVLEIYLSSLIGESAVTTAHVHHVLEGMADPGRLRELLEGTPNDRLYDLFDRLFDLRSSFPAEHAAQAALVVARQEQRLVDHSGGTLGLPARWSVETLVEALLRVVPEAERPAAVMQMIETAPDVSHALRTANRFGTHPEREDRSADAEILDAEATTAVLNDIRGRVRRATAIELRDEPDLRSLLAGLLVPDDGAGRAEIAAKARDDGVMRALVRQSFGWGHRSSGFGTTRVPMLYWASLTSMLDKETLEARVHDLAPLIEPDDEDEKTAWQLALRYASGEEPDRFP